MTRRRMSRAKLGTLVAGLEMVRRIEWLVTTPEGREYFAEATRVMRDTIPPAWAVVGETYACGEQCGYSWQRTAEGWRGPLGESYAADRTHAEFAEQRGDCWYTLQRKYGPPAAPAG